jgi:sugar-phosphatase
MDPVTQPSRLPHPSGPAPGRPLTAILFDCDGVLVDSAAAIDGTWRSWAQERRIDPARVLPFAHGRRTVDVIAAIAPDLPASEVERVERTLAADPGIVAVAGARQLLRRLPLARVGVVTSGTRAGTLTRLHVAGLPIPEVLIAADDVAAGKPDPAGYQLGAERLGNPPAQTVVVEDSPAGIAAATAAGMLPVALIGTHAPDQLNGADAIINGLAELPALLSRLDPSSPLLAEA